MERGKDLISRLIAEIRTVALSGSSETYLYGSSSKEYMLDGEIDIHWQTVGSFILVYIEAYGADTSYGYRLYKCSNGDAFNYKVVLDSALENDDCRCIFSFEENKACEGRLCRLESCDWYREFEKSMSDFN